MGYRDGAEGENGEGENREDKRIKQSRNRANEESFGVKVETSIPLW